MTKVAVIGAGSWGTTFAKVLADGGAEVSLWSRRSELADEINQFHRNGDYLPGVNLPFGIAASADIAEVLAAASQIYLSVPSQSLRENLAEWGHLIPKDALVVSLMKGVEKDSGLRMSQVIADAGIDPSKIVVVSDRKSVV